MCLHRLTNLPKLRECLAMSQVFIVIFSHGVCLLEEPAIYKFLLFKKATETMTGCELSFS